MKRLINSKRNLRYPLGIDGSNVLITCTTMYGLVMTALDGLR